MRKDNDLRCEKRNATIFLIFECIWKSDRHNKTMTLISSINKTNRETKPMNNDEKCDHTSR